MLRGQAQLVCIVRAGDDGGSTLRVVGAASPSCASSALRVADRVEAEPVGVGDEPGRGRPGRAGHGDRPLGRVDARRVDRQVGADAGADLDRRSRPCFGLGNVQLMPAGVAPGQRVGQRLRLALVLGVEAAVGRDLHGLDRVGQRLGLPVRLLDQRVEELAGRVVQVAELRRSCPSPATGAAAARRPSRGRRRPRRGCAACSPAGRRRGRARPPARAAPRVITTPTMVEATAAWSVSTL